jgi:hypothetical protein
MEAAQIFLLSVFCLSIGLSSSVLFLLLTIGIETQSGKLTFLLNLSFLVLSVTKFPIVLVSVPFACAVAGYLYWYFSTLGLLVLYDLVGAVNLRMLAHDQTARTISRASEYKLKNKSLLRLFFISTLSLIAPICSGSFIRTETYCELDRDSESGVFARFIFLLFTLLMQIAIIRKLYLTVRALRKSLTEITYNYLFWQLITGPGAYPIFLILGAFVADIVVLINYLCHSCIEDKQSDYCLELLQAILGILASVVFYGMERSGIEVSQVEAPANSPSCSPALGLRDTLPGDESLREDDLRLRERELGCRKRAPSLFSVDLSFPAPRAVFVRRTPSRLFAIRHHAAVWNFFLIEEKISLR